ncbi:MAG TPA: hypothetical protein VFF71_12235 [Luteimonas sp.]|nr:hypothetical protein [Luteimonas sp.]
MPANRTLAAAALLLLAAAGAHAEVHVVPQHSGVDVRLRGISAVDADTAWASGRDGTVLRTRDGGRSWERIVVPGAESLDFRDVEAFDGVTVVLLAIGPGEASRVYRTDDGGKSWQLVLQNHDPRGFFDCMAFDGQRGWLLGDPVNGHFQVFASANGGRDWTPADGPRAEEGEAAFAASGTCIALAGTTLAVATGGTTSRLHVRSDGDGRWTSLDSGLEAGAESKGVFSLAPLAHGFAAVGGDFQAEGAKANAMRFSLAPAEEADADAGTAKTHVAASALPQTPGYRSGIACTGDATTCIAVGPTGADAWDGTGWVSVSTTGYDAIDLAGSIGWTSGDKGRIARIEIGD